MSTQRPEPTGPASVDVRASLEELLRDLGRPAAYGLDDDEHVDVIQTHISVVFLAGDRAYKVKKPAKFWGLVDYSTFDLRRHWCEEEVRLNQRLAPNVYVGVRPVVRREGRLFVGGEGEVVEHAVVMVRLAEGATWAERLAADTVAHDDVEHVARMIAHFHAQHPLDADTTEHDPVELFDDVLRRNFASTEQATGDVFPQAPHDRAVARMRALLDDARPTLAQRVADGRTVDGHGDLRPDHVVFHAGRWDIIDCVEFTTRLRHVDPLSDLAFLSMGLTVLGRPDLGRHLEEAYVKASGEGDADLLLPLFRAYRAHVRAMVGFVTSQEEEISESQRAACVTSARRYFALAWAESFAGATPPIVVLRGPSGTGKSVLASSFAALLRADIIRSDVVRKELLGMEPTDRPDEEAKADVYGADMSRRTYSALLDYARTAVTRGHCAILDATYLLRSSRDEARALARELRVPFAIIDITCEPDVIRERLAKRTARGDDASDADFSIYEQQMQEADPLGDEERGIVVAHESGADVEPMLMRLLEVFEAQVGANG